MSSQWRLQRIKAPSSLLRVKSCLCALGWSLYHCIVTYPHSIQTISELVDRISLEKFSRRLVWFRDNRARNACKMRNANHIFRAKNVRSELRPLMFKRHCLGWIGWVLHLPCLNFVSGYVARFLCRLTEFRLRGVVSENLTLFNWSEATCIKSKWLWATELGKWTVSKQW